MQYQIFDRMKNPGPNFPFLIENGKTVPLTARAGEEYSICIGVQPQQDGELSIFFSPLAGKSGQQEISAGAFSSISFGGIDYRGEKFEKTVTGKKDIPLLLWVTIQIPQTAQGAYHGTIAICGEGKDRANIPLCLTVDGSAENHGWDEPEKLTRLSWLNSTRAQDGGVTAPYTKPILKDNTVSILGREITVTPVGLPGKMISLFDKNIKIGQEKVAVSDGADLLITFADGKLSALRDFSVQESHVEEFGEGYRFEAIAQSEEFTSIVTTSVEYDGFIGCQLDLYAKKDLKISDISLQYALHLGFDQLMIGLGKVGGKCEDYDFYWDNEKHQNPLWIGGTNGGLRCEFKGENFEEPFVNIYYRHRKYKLSESFCNPKEGVPQGGIRVRKGKNGAVVTAFSGARKLEEGQLLSFDFDFLLTPLKPLDMKQRFQTRYAHFCEDIDFDFAEQRGASHVICHHANKINPYINYPFRTMDGLKQMVDEAHKRGLGAKIYYTLREHSDKTYEMNAEMSLGEEIFPCPNGSQDSILWDATHMAEFKAAYGTQRIPGWVTQYDMSLIADGQSRLCNYYIEGLHYLCEKLNIDGLYIDDTALDRYTMRRTRRILDENGRDAWNGVGCKAPRRIDMHTWNHFCDWAGYGNCLNMYMPLLPYIDTLWIGEAFEHLKASPEYWLTEIAPIPYGVPGEMLIVDSSTYNAKYRGMLFGITFRCTPDSEEHQNPSALWRFFDKMDLANSEMIGFWNEESPAHTNREDVKITAFLGEKFAVLAIAGWNTETAEVIPTLDLAEYDMSRAEIPEIENFQAAQAFCGRIILEKDKGVLITVPKK